MTVLTNSARHMLKAPHTSITFDLSDAPAPSRTHDEETVVERARP